LGEYLGLSKASGNFSLALFRTQVGAARRECLMAVGEIIRRGVRDTVYAAVEHEILLAGWGGAASSGGGGGGGVESERERTLRILTALRAMPYPVSEALAVAACAVQRHHSGERDVFATQFLEHSFMPGGILHRRAGGGRGRGGQGEEGGDGDDDDDDEREEDEGCVALHRSAPSPLFHTGPG
jgi:hypothetical protein